MAPGGKKDLTHDEIWDDSALIESWNDALAEYKKYHSIHLQGEKAKDLLVEGHDGETRDGEGNANEEVDEGEVDKADGKTPDQDASPNVEVRQTPTAHVPMAPPQLILESFPDENLKKLLMSWYYAGYYTGLYEGQARPK